MSRNLRMDTDGSILRTNNPSLESCYMNLRDMIGLYSDEAESVAEKPQDGWAADTGDYGRYLVLCFQSEHECIRTYLRKK